MFGCRTNKLKRQAMKNARLYTRMEYYKNMKSCGAIPLYNNELEYAEIIYNKPATILIVGKRKFVSKAHDEEFDKEKGLLMCLAKYFGITHLQLKRLMKTAKDQTPKSED